MTSGGVVPNGITLSCLRLAGNLGNGSTDIRTRMEKDFDHTDAVQRLRLYVLNIVHDGRQVTLLKNDDSIRHLRRSESGEIPNDAYHGDAYIRKNICGSAKRRKRSQDQDQNSEHHERVGPPERESNNPHKLPHCDYRVWIDDAFAREQLGESVIAPVKCT